MDLLEQPARVKNSFIKTDGLRAWYDENGNPVEPFIIGIAGGSSSGKTYVAG